MRLKMRLLPLTLALAGIRAWAWVGQPATAVPKTWDEKALATLEVPAPIPEFSPRAVSAEYYYRIPVRPIYKSYPVYAAGKEPRGYFEALQQRQPEVLWDDQGHKPRLETESDWVNAGEMVFDAAIFYDAVTTVADVRNPKWYDTVHPPVTPEGILPFTSYVIRQRGLVEVGNNACRFCHTRVLPDGTAIKGAQGNFPFDRAAAFGAEGRPIADLRLGFRALFGAPWLKDDDPAVRVETMTVEEILGKLKAIPAGVAARHRASADAPPAIPDLIGIRDRRYLDKTGLVRQRDIGDLMRYAALNNELDFLSRFGDFIPSGRDFRELPDPAGPEAGGRYSDEQLYALARYLYSLTPPQNPNRAGSLTVRGEGVFRRAGCAACHTPPLYSNNKLIPADGFNVPANAESADILRRAVGTDSTLTLKTRRGTGYYKVPSLKGVWYRGPFEHNGSVATLEDWFDRQRLKDDYVPTAFKPYGVATRAVKGHEFGMRLSPDEKGALIAFLKTL
jgi:hypothetical protein